MSFNHLPLGGDQLIEIYFQVSVYSFSFSALVEAFTGVEAEMNSVLSYSVGLFLRSASSLRACMA